MRLVLGAILLAWASAPAADEVPGWMQARHATDPSACTEAGGTTGGGLALEGRTLWGLEFTCRFVAIHDAGGKKWDEVIAVATCGDDSGITRPDLFSILRDVDGTLRVQSQSEFIAFERGGGDEDAFYTSDTYRACP